MQKMAFTLAEVLITLGIIGIVVALTLPGLINQYRIKQLETSFKKGASIVSNALNVTVNNFGYDSIQNIASMCSSGQTDCPETNKIYFTLKIDKNYVFDSSDISLYVDGDKKQTLNVDIDEAISENGYTGSFDYVYGDMSVIKLENILYDGETQNINISTKFKN